MRILIIEDDPAMAATTEVGLQAAGFDCSWAADGHAALELLRHPKPGPYDLVLLDLGLPGLSGWQLLEQCRDANDATAVIIVSSFDTLEEKVRGLRLGADDYVVKPFQFPELLARIDAVLRRRQSLAPIEIGGLRLDLSRRKVDRAGKPVALSPREFDLLRVLAEARGEVISRKQLLLDVWDMSFDPETNVVDVHLGRLRRKLDRHGRPAIQTVRGLGFRLAVEVL